MNIVTLKPRKLNISFMASIESKRPRGIKQPGNPSEGEKAHKELDNIREMTSGQTKAVSENEILNPEQQESLARLKARFEKNKHLHRNIRWADVEKALKVYPEKLLELQQLEAADAIKEEKGEFIFGKYPTGNGSDPISGMFRELAFFSGRSGFSGLIRVPKA